MPTPEEKARELIDAKLGASGWIVQTYTTDLPELSEGWRWATMDQVFRWVRNGTAIVPRAESGVPILRISAVRPLRVDLTDVRYLTDAEADTAESWVEPGDLFFTR